jgi:hypothetical protein
LIPEHNHPNYNCTVTYKSGDVRKVYGNWLHNTGQDFFKDWHCGAGSSRFYIDKNFNVWSGMCKNDLLGNLKNTWNPLDTFAVCQQPRCGGCTDDLVTKKYKQ